MASRKASRKSRPRRASKKKPVPKKRVAKRSGKRQKKTRKTAAAVRKRKASSKARTPRRPAKTAKRARTTGTRPAKRAPARKVARLNRERRVLREPTPPSFGDLEREGSAAPDGHREMRHSLEEHAGMTPAITGGDVDANWENAYFSGDEAPGGDNPTPDQDRVDDIGRSIGLQYADDEELQGDEKVEARDKHRWELDPASSDDYDDR